MAWAWKHKQLVDQLHEGRQNNHNHTCKRNPRGLGLTVPRGAFYYLCCIAWLWKNSKDTMIVIHWGVQMILLS